MDIKSKAPKLDAIDSLQLQEMVASRPFELFTLKVQIEIKRRQSDLEQEKDPIEIHRHQGAITALRACLTYPQTLIMEAKANGR